MSTETQLPQPGEIVDGKYRVDSLLGKGGMGAVFVVRHVQTQRQFALKCMLAELIGEYEAEQRFIREAKLAGNVGHPGVVETYDIGRHRGSLYMVMELLAGESLSARIARNRFNVGDGAYLMVSILEAVAAAHRKGIVHRDLKPDNIFLQRAPDGRGMEPKILDFGISKALSPDGQPTMGLTKTGVVLGTPLYMSPEQVRGEKTLDQRTDVYALGVIFYEMLTGTPPYNGNNFADLVLKIVTGDTSPPSSRVANISSAVDAVVMRAMHHDPAARFADVMAFARALAPFAVAPVHGSQRPPSGVSTPPPSRRPSAPPPPMALTPFVSESRIDVPPMNRLPWPLFAAAAALVAAGLWFVLSGDGNAVVAEPVVPPVTSAATQPIAPPTNVVPTQPVNAAATAIDAVPELPRGVSPDAIPLGRSTLEEPHPRDQNAAHAHSEERRARPAVIDEAPQVPAVVEPVEPPRPSNDQILDPFSP